MSGPSLSPLFGVAIDPSAEDPREPFRRARMADENGLDLITLMDHPYNAKLFDTWTLLTAGWNWDWGLEDTGTASPPMADHGAHWAKRIRLFMTRCTSCAACGRTQGDRLVMKARSTR